MSRGLTDALPACGLWGLAGAVALLVLLIVLRGRIRIAGGWGGWTLPRFNFIERLVHWVLALSFIVLTLSGLGGLYGTKVLGPLLGAGGHAIIDSWSKQLHIYAAFPFILALTLACLLWIRHSLPHWRDAIWLTMGGGLVVPQWRPAAWKFNAGQKVFFWTVILGGLSLCVTGFALLLPETVPLSKLFALIKGFGVPEPSNLTLAEETLFVSAWHAASALALTCLVVIHVYLRTYGIQGAFAAMGSGEVDVNWAKQHHSLWAKREIKRAQDVSVTSTPATGTVPAE